MAQPSITGASVIAQTLKELGVTVVFGIVGVPVSDIAEQAINLGIRFIGLRNEQAASYAATAYGYLTGKPGVCLVVGGPGVLHAIAGIGNASENNFPMLLLGGSIETHLVTKGAFQELDSVALLSPRTKVALRPSNTTALPKFIAEAYRSSWYGRPGPGFVDLPADIIMDSLDSTTVVDKTPHISSPPKGGADEERLQQAIELIKSAKAPLLLVGKGAAYARAEKVLRRLVDSTQIPFLPSPMGKGVLPDSHPLNATSARSAALKHADVVLIFGARLNWIFHYGEPPKWNTAAQFIQIDNTPEELGRNAADPKLAILGDIKIIVEQLSQKMGSWQYDVSSSAYMSELKVAKAKNEVAVARAAAHPSTPLSYAHVFDIIRKVLQAVSPPEEGGIVYVAEGANTMDISRSFFALEHPRLRLDAGTYATMGVGLPYAIAAFEAYNGPGAQATSGPVQRKKVVAIEGDSAFGFSGMEIETMARFQMDILIFVINNSGIYFGDSDSAEDWIQRQSKTVRGEPGLRSWALGWEVNYEKMAEAVGGIGILVRTPEELREATLVGYHATVPVIVNVIIQSGKVEKPSFGWEVSPKKSKAKGPRL